ncbi:MAG: hypothetical protein NVSMB9_33660 [Isosphaeraceae bacterium]
MPIDTDSWLAFDIGGANLKAAHSAGLVHSLPFELWRRPENLPANLSRLAALFPRPTRLVVTMTAELCDCYATKQEGVHSVLDALSASFADRPIQVWGIDGRLHSPEQIRRHPLLAAAANWLALATVVAGITGPGPGLLIDVGSTTTDLIPLHDGRVVARGRTDTERLQTGELVYAGVRRTPLCALAHRVPFRGRATALAAELFATTLDVFLSLGDLPEDPLDFATADGRPATVVAARDRLARMVCADREGFSPSDAAQLSIALVEILFSRLEHACAQIDPSGSSRPSTIVVSGSGEFFAGRLGRRLLAPGGRLLRLSESWGPLSSSAACASALLRIASDSAQSERE